ncbi:resuscitation-promoting factor [Cellulomonas massiliensis]|uniref:resuscitation-promoting factor n=1 Tax=Cellulomonas massiliensis TaxID=1465811 RepID=UPI00248278DF|nr:resuscitation-promoting factor [Cellulomonas massiliensis]
MKRTNLNGPSDPTLALPVVGDDAADAAPRTPAAGGTTPEGRRSRRSRALVVTAAAAALVLGGGSAAYAHAHKDVTLDVDGDQVALGTFAGSVDALLEDRGVTVGDRDTVSASGALRDGQTVVVRHARQITVAFDGEQRTVWSTALTADEALDALADRGHRVTLVASRSLDGGRVAVPLDLEIDGSARVLVDGTTKPVPAGATTVAQALDALGVTLDELDRVTVRARSEGGVEVVVNRIERTEVRRAQTIAFDTRRKADSSLYTGTTKVVTEGKAGKRAITFEVTTVDGTVTRKEKIDAEVVRKPVDQVVAVGTKDRPAPKPSSSPASSSSSGSAVKKAKGSTDDLNWAALAQCESGGNPRIVSSNGLYHGLYQFSVGTWRAVGGSGLPSQASAAEQTARAKTLYERSGAGQWPVCGSRLFS